MLWGRLLWHLNLGLEKLLSVQNSAGYSVGVWKIRILSAGQKKGVWFVQFQRNKDSIQDVDCYFGLRTINVKHLLNWDNWTD